MRTHLDNATGRRPSDRAANCTRVHARANPAAPTQLKRFVTVPSVNAATLERPVQRRVLATRSRRTEQLQRIITSAAAVDVADAVLASEDELLSGLEGPVLVWFKSDLRTADHPGLASAARAGVPVVPFFCFDPQLYRSAAFSPAGAEVLVDAAAGLRAELQAAGSDLVVRTGQASFYLPALCAYAGIKTVVVQEEGEARWLAALDEIEVALAAEGVRLVRWRSHAWAQPAFSSNYRSWKKQRGEMRPALPAPAQLPALLPDVEPGHMPCAATMARLLAAAATSGCDEVEAQAVQAAQAAAEDPIAGVLSRLLASGYSTQQLMQIYIERDVLGLPRELAWLTPQLQQLDGPAAPRASLATLLGPSLALGRLSRRQVIAMAEQCERKRYGGWLPPTGVSSPSAAAAIKLAETSEFHWQLALEGQALGGEAQAAEQVCGGGRKCWRWRGTLTDYWCAEPSGPSPSPDAPAILLVHGFGAFGDQWRGNVAALAAGGYRVYAPTLPGFGRSEKAPVAYSQDGWRDFLRDFIVQVVRGPVVLVGNSIGGFISASVAADYPDLAAGLVLLNSAGPIDAKYSPAKAPARRSPPPSPVASAISLGLLAYLERSIKPTLKWLYPTNPGAADEWLGDEIYRAACDPGSFEVFRSVFYLPPPRPLNHLVAAAYGGPTRVLQGRLDPLNDAQDRAQQLAELCPNVDVVLLDAGHCPHDEQPGVVNDGILDFMAARVVGAEARVAANA